MDTAGPEKGHLLPSHVENVIDHYLPDPHPDPHLLCFAQGPNPLLLTEANRIITGIEPNVTK